MKSTTLKPETAKLLAWARNWLTEKGYEVQESLPWKSWRWNTPTILYALNDDGKGVFGLLCHLISVRDLVKRFGQFMNTTPRPVVIFLFVPANSPHEVHGELKGFFSYDVQVVEAPDYPYDRKHYEGKMWGSSFSISLSKRGSEPKE